MKEAIMKLESEIKAHTEKLEKLQNALSALKALCQHDYQYIGHTHNDNVYQCTICKKTEYR